MAKRTRKAPEQVRAEAHLMARNWAEERASCGDPEGAECFRMLAREIAAMRLTKDVKP